MTDRLADARPLGFAALGTGFWMFGMINAGWYPEALGGGYTASWVVVFLGISLLVAGIAEYLRGDAWHGFVFLIFAAFSYGLGEASGEPNAAYEAWWYLLWTVFLFAAWMGATRRDLGSEVTYFALAAALAFLAAALNGFLGSAAFLTAAGYLDLVAGLLALWVAVSGLMGAGGSAAESTGTAAGGAGGGYGGA